MKIGNQTFIGNNCMISAKERIVIGEKCLIAEGVTIRDQDHVIFREDHMVEEPSFTTSAITIEDNVWLGAKVTVLKGVRIGRNSIVGANAVVVKDLPENSVAVGVPAKVIKTKK